MDMSLPYAYSQKCDFMKPRFDYKVLDWHNSTKSAGICPAMIGLVCFWTSPDSYQN